MASSVYGGEFVTNADTSVDTTAGGTQIVAARNSRRYVIIKNTHASITIYVGSSDETVASTLGMELKAGESMTLHTTAALKALAASSSVTVKTTEVYD